MIDLTEIEYKLKFLLNSTTLKHIDTKNILEQNKLDEFNNTYSNTIRKQLFCNKIDEVTFFPIQTVPIQSNNTIHTVYLCDVAVGNSICVVKDFIDQKLPIPHDYDTLITDFQNSQAYLSDMVVKLNDFYYVVNDSSRILPLYEITFEYDSEFEKRARNRNICHKCQKEESIVYCPSERASFCGNCDQLVHSDIFLKRHERKYFETCGQKKFINCPTHETKTIEFYCIDCGIPICSYCKISGNHSTIDFANHRIILFTEACKNLDNTIYESSSTIELLKNNNDDELQKFNDNIAEFKFNIAKIRQKLDKEYKNLMLELEVIENKKIQILNANYIEILNQSDFFTQMKKFPEELDPTDRLQYFNAIKHQREMKEIPKLTVEPFLPIELIGKLQIKIPNTVELRITNNDIGDKCSPTKIEMKNITKLKHK